MTCRDDQRRHSCKVEIGDTWMATGATMTATILAWVLEGPDRFVLERVALPPLRPGWVRCQVIRFQPSVTDVMRFRGLHDAQEYQRGRRFIGHEFVARVVETCEPASSSLVGCRVVCPARNPCGSCESCLHGQPYLCARPVRLGSEGSGAMAEMIDLPAAYTYVVPEGVSDLAACCSQPAASAVANIVHAGVTPAARTVILGQGTMGLLMLQAVRAHGASEVLTTAPRPSVRRLSMSLGACDSLEPDAPETPARLREFAPDIAIDAAGGPQAVGLSGTGTLGQALDCVRVFGTVLEISDITVPITLSAQTARKAIRLIFGHGGYFYYGVYPHTLALLKDGRIRCDSMVTHIVQGISRLPDALDLMARRHETDARQVQVVVDAEA